MLNPGDFRSLWGNDAELAIPTVQSIEKLILTEESRNFLIEAGLPRSAAPYLDFDLNSSRSFSPVQQVWTCLESNYSIYRFIGGTGWGDPICIDEAKPSQIIYLNHDDDFKLVFVNSSVPQLAHCLLTFREFVEKICQVGGEDAFLDGIFPPDCWEWVCEQFKEIDDSALDEGAFWASELHIYK